MKTKVVVVEDEALIALDLKSRLERAGYSVPSIADNSDEALRTIEADRPALVLMDIRLRGPRDGIETAAEIRRRYDIPVIFVTAHADRDTLNRARITEPFGYVVKPFVGVDFHAQVEIALWKHQMERRLRASEAWFSKTFHNVADALITTDSKGNITLMNEHAAELTEWSREDAIGKALWEVFPVLDESSGLPAALAAESENAQAISTSTFRLPARGTRAAGFLLVEAEISTNWDGDTSLGLIVVFRDITQRRRAEEQKQHQQKMNALALMASGLARELSQSQEAADRVLIELIPAVHGSSARRMEVFYRHFAHQRALVRELAAFGNSEPGTPVLTDVAQLLEQMEPQLANLLGRSQLLSLEPGPAPLIVLVHPEGLRQAVLRLVLEAGEASNKKGTVTLTTAIDRASNHGAPSVRISIGDAGPEIPPDARRRVFEPYYEARSVKRGSRFSLAMVHYFVSASGGFLECDSDPAKGATFTLSLPLAKVPVDEIEPYEGMVQ